MPNKLCYGWNEVVMGILLWQTAITSIKHRRVSVFDEKKLDLLANKNKLELWPWRRVFCRGQFLLLLDDAQVVPPVDLRLETLTRCRHHLVPLGNLAVFALFGSFALTVSAVRLRLMLQFFRLDQKVQLVRVQLALFVSKSGFCFLPPHLFKGELTIIWTTLKKCKGIGWRGDVRKK